MEFKDAYKLMKDGNKIKLPTWGGYWYWDGKTIIIHTKDGEEFDFRKTEDPDYTISFMLSNKWIIANEHNCPELGGECLFGFNDAINQVVKGRVVKRKVWKSKSIDISNYSNYFEIFSDLKVDEDLNANDWMFCD